jgi:hypothetical protein
MDRSVTQGARRAVIGLGLLGLLALVAVAATGAAPDAGGAQRPSQWALDVVASLVLVTLVPGSLLLVLVILLRPQAMLEVTAARRERKRGLGASLTGVGLGVVLIVLAVRRLSGEDAGSNAPLVPAGGLGGGVPARPAAYEPSFALVPVIVTLAVLGIGALAAVAYLRARRSDGEPGSEGVAVAIGEVLDEAVDDLRAERDARRAVIAAYARLERVLAAYGLPRRPSEAPEEYLERVLPALEVSGTAVARLTTLFGAAKFSQHDVGAAMKEEALDALETARDELRLAAARERAARDEALAIARERTAG